MLVKTLMSLPVTVCRLEDNLGQVAKLMWEGDCGAIPVVDGVGRAVAMVTDRDICMAAYLQGKPLWEIAVRTAMSPALHACGPEDPLEQAELLMRDYQIRRLPVLDPDGRPVGMLSLNDLARAAVRRHPSAVGVSPAGARVAATARTLAAICAPHAIVQGGAGPSPPAPPSAASLPPPRVSRAVATRAHLFTAALPRG